MLTKRLLVYSISCGEDYMKKKYLIPVLFIGILLIFSCSMPLNPEMGSGFTEYDESLQALSVETDASRNIGIYITEKGTRIDITSYEDSEERIVNCVDVIDIKSIKYSSLNSYDRTSLEFNVKALILGKRDDGNPGIWEVHTDDTIHPIMISADGKSSSLLMETDENEGRIGKFFGWNYNVTAISDDLKMIVGYTENLDGINRGRWRIEPGTRIGVYWRLGSVRYGRFNGVSRARVIGEPIKPNNLPSFSNKRIERFFHYFINRFRLFFIKWLDAYLVTPEKVIYNETGDLYEVTGIDQDNEKAIARIDNNNNIIITKTDPPTNKDIDLEPGQISLNADNIAFGEDLTIAMTINNLDDGSTSETFQVSFYLSADNTFSPVGDILLSSPLEITGGLGSKETKSLTHIISIPNMEIDQNVFIYAVVDYPDNAIDETDESNNISTITNAGYIFAFNGSDPDRKYEINISTYAPTGTDPNPTPNLVLYLYDNLGQEIKMEWGGYPTITRSGTSALGPGNYYIKIDKFAAGAYALAVSLTGNTPYFSQALSSEDNDLYEPDNISIDNIPESPVNAMIGDSFNRYIGATDIDWFKITLP
jgi:CARDB